MLFNLLDKQPELNIVHNKQKQNEIRAIEQGENNEKYDQIFHLSLDKLSNNDNNFDNYNYETEKF